MLLSVVIPVLNEEKNIKPLYERLVASLSKIDNNFEIIFVDDGSNDGSSALVTGLHKTDPRVKLLSFSRNFGHQVALTAGLDYAQGEAVVLMDGDLQHPPELIGEMVRTWRTGVEVVYTTRTISAEDTNLIKRATSSLFYCLFKLLTRLDMPVHTADFRLLDKRVVSVIKKLRERRRFLRGLMSWVGFRSASIDYEPEKRHAGESKYDWKRMIQLAIDGIVSFSAVPLYGSILAGFILEIFAIGYAFFILYVRFISHQVVPGWTSVILAVLGVGGMQLLMLGVAGLYIAAIYDEIKQRPVYVLDHQLGVERPS